jgi:phenylpropionate dioxygenase-like ring-hydroxylating dioxygenase large terminal subunit
MSKENSLQAAAEHLYEYAASRSTFQTDKVMTIPSSSYTDEDIWTKEVDNIFRKLPLALATTAELREKNAYKAMDAAGFPVLITRGKDGKARAFLNVCSHRAASVADVGCGIKARFTCRYHGWTYTNSGELMGVSEGQTFGEIDKSTRGLRELPCEEKAGLIFVILTPDEPMNLDSFMDGMLDDLETANFKDWCYLGTRELDGANWKIAFDGYLEGYHFAQLHPETIHPRTISNLTHYEAFGPHMRIGFAQTDIVEQLDAAPRDTWGTMENSGYDFVRILFPNLSVFLAPEITQIAQLFPGETPDKNRTVLTFFRLEGPKDEEDKAGLEGMMDFLLNVVRDEDYTTGDIIQKGLESGAHDSIILGKNERGNQFFHENLAYYMGGCEGPKPTM